MFFLRLRCSGEPKEEKKNTIFFLSDFISENFRKNLVFYLFTVKTVNYYQEFTRKLLESHPESGSGNYLEGARNYGLP